MLLEMRCAEYGEHAISPLSWEITTNTPPLPVPSSGQSLQQNALHGYLYPVMEFNSSDPPLALVL